MRQFSTIRDAMAFLRTLPRGTRFAIRAPARGTGGMGHVVAGRRFGSRGVYFRDYQERLGLPTHRLSWAEEGPDEIYVFVRDY